jgi:hypothetical protein
LPEQAGIADLQIDITAVSGKEQYRQRAEYHQWVLAQVGAHASAAFGLALACAHEAGRLRRLA